MWKKGDSNSILERNEWFYKSMKPRLNNQERTQILAAKAKTALLESAGRDWTKAKEAIESANHLELKAVNLLRTSGVKLQEAANHEQVSFEFYHSAAPSLPSGMTFAAVKVCIHLARNYDKPIENRDEARKALQMMWEAFGAQSAPKRLEPQTAHADNPWDHLVSSTSSLTSLFSALETDHMETWDRDRLAKFVSTTKPIAEAHKQAAILLEESK